jgi:hypothetical protein
MRVEMLKDRQLMSTITVNTTDDDTSPDMTLSLLEAIEVSNGTLAISSLSTQAQISRALSAPNTIDFDISGSGIQTHLQRTVHVHRG